MTRPLHAAGSRPACAGVDPEAFFVDGWTEAEQAGLEAVAHRTCARCPLLEQCARIADRDRLWGLWSGSYRLVSQGRYKRRPLIAAAPMDELPARPVPLGLVQAAQSHAQMTGGAKR